MRCSYLIVGILSLFYPFIYSQCLTYDDRIPFGHNPDLSTILSFDLELFKTILPRNTASDFVFSPYSIWNALVLAYFGSGGETERQLQNILAVDDKLATLAKWRDLEFLYYMRPETSINNTFVVANKVFFDDNVVLRQCMLGWLHSEVETLDFTRPWKAANYINQFVEQVTQGTIKDLVSSDDVQNAQMVLANAAYFKGMWKTPFDPLATELRPFYTPDGNQVFVEMMSTTGEFLCGYNDDLGVDFMELPYDGEILSMFIFLPYESTHEAMNLFLDNLTPTVFKKAIDSMYYASNLQVLLPKFKLETNSGDDLIHALATMGLTSPFDPLSANFTYFAPYQPMFLAKSIHQSYISVDEQGTVASAATVFVSLKSAGNVFRCDRSFAFAIRDNETKNILFIGIYKGQTGIKEGPTYPMPVGQTQDNYLDRLDMSFI